MNTQTITIQLNQTTRKLKARLNAKVESVLAAFVGWLLSYRAVQKEIAEVLEDGGYMCRVLRNAVEEYYDSSAMDDEIGTRVEKAVEELDVEKTVADAIEELDVEGSIENALDELLGSDNFEDAVRESLIKVMQQPRILK